MNSQRQAGDWTWCILVLLIMGGLEGTARAHPGLHHDIDAVTQALAREPGQPDLFLKRARLFRLDHQYEAALADVKKARVLAGDVPEVLLERGLDRKSVV